MLKNSIFNNRVALLVSMHGKEQAIAPPLKTVFNVDLNVSKDIYTDAFGTFSGEIERLQGQYETAKLKIAEAIKKHPQSSLFIASEGSFNPYPDAPFITLNTELLLLTDIKYNIEIAAWHHSTNTNMAAQQIESIPILNIFLKQVGFPSHKIILKAYNANSYKSLIVKGMDTIEAVNKEFIHLQRLSDDIIIEAETDMRAFNNPTRLNNINECATKLVEAMQSTCPKCSTPGFSATDILPGLPCAQCEMPTRSTLYYIYKCSKCGHTAEEKFPKGKTTEDPMYCDFCNP